MPCTELYYTQLEDCLCPPWKLVQTAARVFCLQHTVSTYMTSLHPTMNGFLHFFPVGLNLKKVTLKYIFPWLSSDFYLKRTFELEDAFGFPGWVSALMPLVNSLLSILSSERWLCKLSSQEMWPFSLLCILFCQENGRGKALIQFAF